jgi:hypothetical protein
MLGIVVLAKKKIVVKLVLNTDCHNYNVIT